MKKFLKHKKLFAGIFLVLVIFSFAPVSSPQAYAFINPGAQSIINSSVGKEVGCVWGTSWICDLVTKLIFIPLAVTSFILFLAGTILDWSIDYTVVDVAKNLGKISGINIAWSVIRDLVNISFIFILLYSAISIILNRGGEIKKIVTGVVLAVILINFSLFFTKIIVDASNLVTLTFRNAIVTSCDPKNESISACFSEYTGVSTIFNPSDATGKALLQSLQGEPLKAATVSLGGSAFILVTAFVFFAASIMFLMRFVSIVFLLIFSPIMVMGSLIPGLSEHTKKWWENITDQALFAPVFMVLTWVVLTVVGSPGFIVTKGGRIADIFVGINKAVGSGGSSLATAPATTPSPLDLIGNFIIVIALIIGVLTISKGFSKKGGELGGKFAGAIMGGAGGYIGRRTIGGASRSISDSEELKRQAANEGGKYGRLTQMKARALLKTAQGGAKASFDVRGAKVPFTDIGLSKSLGAGTATGKGGYDAYLKEQAEKKKKFGESPKPSDIVIDQAKQELEAAKNSPNDPGKDKRVHDAQERLNDLLGNKDEVDTQLKALDEQKKKESDDAKSRTAQAARLAEAENALDNAKVSEKSAEDTYRRLEVEADAAVGETRAAKIREVEAARLRLDTARTETGDTRRALAAAKTSYDQVGETIDSDLDRVFAERKKQLVDERLLESAEDRRKKGYASVLTDTARISLNRVGLVGAIKQSNRQAAANLRGTGGKKSVKERLQELLDEEAGRSAGTPPPPPPPPPPPIIT
jgi:hypothetical protein